MTARGGMRPHTAQRQAEHPGLTHQPQGCCSMVSRRQRKPTQASRSSHRQAPPGPHLHEARPSPVEPVSALVCRRRRVHPAVTAVGHQAPDAGVPQEARDIPHRVPRQAERASPQRQRPLLPPPPPALPDPTGSALKRNPAETGAQPKASRGRRECSERAAADECGHKLFEAGLACSPDHRQVDSSVVGSRTVHMHLEPRAADLSGGGPVGRQGTNQYCTIKHG